MNYIEILSTRKQQVISFEELQTNFVTDLHKWVVGDHKKKYQVSINRNVKLHTILMRHYITKQQEKKQRMMCIKI